jgi:hypothetical protein
LFSAIQVSSGTLRNAAASSTVPARAEPARTTPAGKCGSIRRTGSAAVPAAATATTAIRPNDPVFSLAKLSVIARETTCQRSPATAPTVAATPTTAPAARSRTRHRGQGWASTPASMAAAKNPAPPTAENSSQAQGTRCVPAPFGSRRNGPAMASASTPSTPPAATAIPAVAAAGRRSTSRRSSGVSSSQAASAGESASGPRAWASTSSPAAAPMTSAAPATAWAGAAPPAPPVPPGPFSRPNGCASRSHSKITPSTTAKPVEYQSYQGRRRRLRMNDLIAATRGGPAAVAAAITGPARVASSARRRSA